MAEPVFQSYPGAEDHAEAARQGLAPETRPHVLLRSARLAAGLSLRELARRAGTSHATLSAYEQGKKVPSIDTFLRVLHASEFAVDFVLRPRVRWRNGVARGEELAEALELAEQFPSRHEQRRTPLAFPRFGSAKAL